MLTHIRSIHKEVKGAYGSPRMTRGRRARGYPANKERVERLMRENGIRARHKRRFKVDPIVGANDTAHRPYFDLLTQKPPPGASVLLAVAKSRYPLVTV